MHTKSLADRRRSCSPAQRTGETPRCQRGREPCCAGSGKPSPPREGFRGLLGTFVSNDWPEQQAARSVPGSRGSAKLRSVAQGLSHFRIIFRQLLNLACRVVKAQMGFRGSGLSPSSATDFLRDLGQVFCRAHKIWQFFPFFLSSALAVKSLHEILHSLAWIDK